MEHSYKVQQAEQALKQALAEEQVNKAGQDQVQEKTTEARNMGLLQGAGIRAISPREALLSSLRWQKDKIIRALTTMQKIEDLIGSSTLREVELLQEWERLTSQL